MAVISEEAYLHAGGPSSTGTVSDASAQLLPVDKRRRYLHITNLDDTNSIFLTLNADGPAVVNSGVYIGPKGSYEMNSGNLYKGAIYAIASAGTPAYSMQIGR